MDAINNEVFWVSACAPIAIAASAGKASAYALLASAGKAGAYALLASAGKAWLAAAAIGPAASITGVAELLVKDKSMSETSDLKHTRELEAPFLKSIAEHHGIVHKICRAYCNNRADEEDLYQEIVYQLWKFYPSFKGDSQFSTWMYSVALRSAILPFRRSRVRIEFPDAVPDRPSDSIQDDGI